VVIPPKNVGMIIWVEPESSSHASHSLRLPDKITTPKILPVGLDLRPVGLSIKTVTHRLSLRASPSVSPPRYAPQHSTVQLSPMENASGPRFCTVRPRPSPVHILTLRHASSLSWHPWPRLSKVFRVDT